MRSAPRLGGSRRWTSVYTDCRCRADHRSRCRGPRACVVCESVLNESERMPMVTPAPSTLFVACVVATFIVVSLSGIVGWQPAAAGCAAAVGLSSPRSPVSGSSTSFTYTTSASVEIAVSAARRYLRGDPRVLGAHVHDPCAERLQPAHRRVRRARRPDRPGQGPPVSRTRLPVPSSGGSASVPRSSIRLRMNRRVAPDAATTGSIPVGTRDWSAPGSQETPPQETRPLECGYGRTDEQHDEPDDDRARRAASRQSNCTPTRHWHHRKSANRLMRMPRA